MWLLSFQHGICPVCTSRVDLPSAVESLALLVRCLVSHSEVAAALDQKFSMAVYEATAWSETQKQRLQSRFLASSNVLEQTSRPA